jgi:hypothetical protein
MAQIYSNTALVAGTSLVMSTGGQLAFLHFWNPSNATAYVQVFDAKATANVNVGTTTPTAVFATATLTGITPIELGIGDGLQFGNGIVVAATTTATGSSAPSTGLVVTIGYRAG